MLLRTEIIFYSFPLSVVDDAPAETHNNVLQNYLINEAVWITLTKYLYNTF